MKIWIVFVFVFLGINFISECSLYKGSKPKKKLGLNLVFKEDSNHLEFDIYWRPTLEFDDNVLLVGPAILKIYNTTTHSRNRIKIPYFSFSVSNFLDKNQFKLYNKLSDNRKITYLYKTFSGKKIRLESQTKHISSFDTLDFSTCPTEGIVSCDLDFDNKAEYLFPQAFMGFQGTHSYVVYEIEDKLIALKESKRHPGLYQSINWYSSILFSQKELRLYVHGNWCENIGSNYKYYDYGSYSDYSQIDEYQGIIDDKTSDCIIKITSYNQNGGIVSVKYEKH